MSTFTVSSTSALVDTFEAASSGDVIRLQPGIYSDFRLRNESFDKEVTITSDDPNRPAVLQNLFVQNVDSIAIEDVEIKVSDASFALQILGSDGVRLEDVFVHGSLDGNPANDQSGILVRDSTNISVENSLFRDLKNGFAALDSRGIEVIGNAFTDLRSDGTRAAGSSDVTFSKNVFTNFFPADGDHPDVIQFWTRNAKGPNENLTITDNIYFRGKGGIAQGIFLGEEEGDKPYKNVTIEGNTLLGTLWNGVFVSNGSNIDIRDNTIAGWDGFTSWVRLDEVNGVTLANNASEKVIIEKSSNVSESGREIVDIDSATDPWVIARLADAAAVGGFSDAARTLLETVTTVPSTPGSQPSPAPEPEPDPEPVAADAKNDTASVAEDGKVTIDVLKNDSGDDVRLSTVEDPENGSATISNNKIVFTPDANFNGTETFDYTVKAGRTSDTAEVRVIVAARNDKPDARGDSADTEEGDSVLIDVLGNDRDIDGDILAIANVTNGENGTVVISGDDVLYTPDADFFGQDFFEYTASDGNGGTDTARVKVDVDALPIDDGPQVVDEPDPVIDDPRSPDFDLQALIDARLALLFEVFDYNVFDIA